MAVSLAVVAVVLAARAAALVLRGLRVGGRTGRVGGVRAADRARCCGCRGCPCWAAPRSRGCPGWSGWCSARTGSARRSGSCSSGCGAGGSRRARGRAVGGLMDLGLREPRRARHRRLEGHRLRDRGGARRRGRAGGGRLARRGADRARRPTRIGAHPVVFDSDDLDAVPGVIDDVEAALGPIDVYVANTGGPPGGPDPLGFTRAQWEAAHRTLVLSPMAFLERLLPGMRTRGWGRVVAVGSMAVREPIAGLQLSNAHRPGLVAAFKVLATPGRGRRRDAQHRPARPDRHRPDLRQRTARARRRGGGARGRARRPARHASRSSPPRPSSSAPRRPPTSPARRCWSTAALTASV